MGFNTYRDICRTNKRLKNYKRCSNLTLQTDIYIQPPPTHPHLFDSIVMHPANQSLMVSGGTQYTEDDDEVLEEDLDSYGRKKRSIKLGYQVEKFEPETTIQEREYSGNNLKTLFKKRKRIIKH